MGYELDILVAEFRGQLQMQCKCLSVKPSIVQIKKLKVIFAFLKFSIVSPAHPLLQGAHAHLIRRARRIYCFC